MKQKKQENQENQENQETEIEDVSVYQELNEIYSLYYSYRYFFDQMQCAYENNNYRTESTSEKLSAYNEYRLELIKNILNEIDIGLKEFDVVFLPLQKRFIDNLNEFFGVKLSINDYFDRFHIKYKPLKEFFEKFSKDINFASDLKNLKLFEDYNKYFINYQVRQSVQGCRDIIEELNGQYDSEGYRTIYWNKIRNGELETISGAEIEDWANILKDMQKELKVEIKTKKLDEESAEEVLKYLNALASYLNVFIDRYKSANTNYFTTAGRMRLWFVDKIAGVPTFKKTKIDEIFITKDEIDIIKKVFEQVGLGEFFEQIVAEHKKVREKESKITENTGKDPLEDIFEI